MSQANVFTSAANATWYTDKCSISTGNTSVTFQVYATALGTANAVGNLYSNSIQVPANSTKEVYVGSGNKLTVVGAGFTLEEIGTASSAQSGVIGGIITMRASEFIAEDSHAKFRDDQLGPMTGMMRYDGLDNSSPYKMWRFLVAAAGQPLDPDTGHPMSKESPSGQKFTTLAYTKADADILAATARAMGETGTPISDMASTEPDETNNKSPVAGFAGYKRK